jgi:hypothetical protein
MKATCECGHEFVLAGEHFSVWHNECECCGPSYHLEVQCPKCHKEIILRESQ